MLSRRQFITRSGAAGAAVVLAPQAALEAAANGKAKPLLRGGRFAQGVLSGDPTPRGITLLTVLDDVSGAGAVRLEVARDRDFRRVVAREAIAFVVCLGDYVYSEAYHSVAGGTGVRDDAIGEPNPQNDDIVSEALTLADYRAKYALYRSDKALRDLHARFPMVAIWDDHEVQDNYAGGAPGGGLDPTKRWAAARRRAGYKAYFEAMPFFAAGGDRVYRSERHGRNVDLIMLDQRQYRNDQPCGDAVAPPCADWDQPRAFLGRRQMNWLKRRLRSSKARWKVIGSQTMMMPAKVTGGSFYAFDSWQGYPQEREELLAYIRDRGIDDVVFLTGDIHLFIAGDVRTNMGEGESVAVEFVGGSITSTNFGEMDIDAGGGVIIPGN